MGEGTGLSDQGDLFRLKACPGCDYSLETLPAEGVCPECGRRYDQGFIVLTGRGRGRWDGAAGGTWRGLAAQLVWVVILLWVFTSGRRAFSSPQLVVFGAVSAVALVTQLYARLFSAREPRMQLWLSRDGVGQVPSTPEARQARSIAGNVSLFSLPVFYGGLLLGSERKPGWIPVTFIAALFVVAAILWWRRRKRRGRLDGVDYTPGLWRWGTVERIEVKVLSGERARVRCRVTQKWWRIAVRKEWVIDIEIECPADAAERLRWLMLQWSHKLRGSALAVVHPN